jgi:hypothetical protein
VAIEGARVSVRRRPARRVQNPVALDDPATLEVVAANTALVERGALLPWWTSRKVTTV